MFINQLQLDFDWISKNRFWVQGLGSKVKLLFYVIDNVVRAWLSYGVVDTSETLIVTLPMTNYIIAYFCQLLIWYL